MVVAHRAVAAQHRLEQGFAVERVLERQAHVVVVEGRGVGAHRDAVVPGAGGLLHHDAGGLGEQVHGLEIAAVHGVDLAGLERVGARRDVDDREELHLVEVGAIRGLPVVLEARETGTHPGLEVVELVASAPDARLPVDAVSVRGQDGDVVVADDVGEVGVAAVERDHHRVSALDADVGHRLQQGFRGRLGILVPVVVDGSHHVVGVESLAVMEFDALANLEAPGGGIRRGLPALGQLRLEAVDRYLGEMVVLGHVENRHVAVLEGRRIQGVGGRAVGDPDPELSALLRGRGQRRPGKQTGREHSAGPQRGRPGHELPARNRAGMGLRREGRESCLGGVVHCRFSGRMAWWGAVSAPFVAITDDNQPFADPPKGKCGD